MRALLGALLVLGLTACGSSDAEDSPAADAPAGSDATGSEPADVAASSPGDEPDGEQDDTEIADESAEAGEAGEAGEAVTGAPGPGDAVGTLTGPDLDIAVVGRCDYDASDLASADVAFADVRGIDPAGVEWPVRFGLSGSSDRNTQVNINGTQVVVRWAEPGVLEQTSDEGSYLLDTTIGRLVVATAAGYELNISCFER